MLGFSSISSAPISAGSDEPSVATVAADFLGAFAVRNFVGANLSAAYAIAQAPGLVFADFASSFGVRKFVHADLIGAFGIGSDVIYVNAPDGAGYVPWRDESQVRPASIQTEIR